MPVDNYRCWEGGEVGELIFYLKNKKRVIARYEAIPNYTERLCKSGIATLRSQ